jgi:hypothetical protein
MDEVDTAMPVWPGCRCGYPGRLDRPKFDDRGFPRVWTARPAIKRLKVPVIRSTLVRPGLLWPSLRRNRSLRHVGHGMYPGVEP